VLPARRACLIPAIVADSAGPFTARALTRDARSEQARDLAAHGVEVIEADLNDETSLRKAFDRSQISRRLFGVNDPETPELFGCAASRWTSKHPVAQQKDRSHPELAPIYQALIRWSRVRARPTPEPVFEITASSRRLFVVVVRSNGSITPVWVPV